MRVLLIIFNRPDVTEKVFEAIRQAAPAKLYIAADGPRENRADDKDKCLAARAILDRVDWSCEVKTLFRDKNLGCKIAVSSGITWFFENEEEGIILEDDCLPHPDFFIFAAQMLQRYRDDDRIMHLTGQSVQHGVKNGEASYYFSRIAHVWGWASWRRAWRLYDVNMSDYESFKNAPDVQSFFYDRYSKKYWLHNFDMIIAGLDTWDFQWCYAIMKNRGLCIVPNVNMISNIGFGKEATHTIEASNQFANLPVYPILPVVDPVEIKPNETADLLTIKKYFPKLTFRRRVYNKLRKILTTIG